MNFNKEYLISLGLTEELADKIIAAHKATLDGYVPIERLNTKNAKISELEAEVTRLGEQNKALEETAGDSEKFKKELEKQKEENTRIQQEYQEKETARAAEEDKRVKNLLVEAAAHDAGAHDKVAVRTLLDSDGLLDKLTLSDDKKTLYGLKEVVESYKSDESKAFLFNKTGKPTVVGGAPGSNTGGSGGGSPTNNPWATPGNIDERCRIAREDPELAKRLKAEAGL